MKLTDKIEVLNEDCMEVMARYPDKHFELAVVDVPYGIDASNDARGGKQHGNAIAPSKSYGAKEWDKEAPPQQYFDELIRVSKNQIVWGANHFISKIPRDSSCWLVWDKVTGDNNYADCELAWTSFPLAVRQFTFMWKGMFQQNMRAKENRIHPTQKPVALYDWIFKNYAEQGMKILDTHGGSMSSVISADKAGLEMVCCELDKEYFDKAVERFKQYKSQETLQFKRKE